MSSLYALSHVITLPAKVLIRRRWWVLLAWALVAALLAPNAARVQDALAVRGGSDESTESFRAGEALKAALPNPIAEYVAVVVRGPVPVNHPRFVQMLDSLSAALSRKPYIKQVVSAQSLGESTFVSKDRHTTFLIAAMETEQTDNIKNNFVPDIRSTLASVVAAIPGAGAFDVKLTGDPALDYDIRTISAEDTQHGEHVAVPFSLAVLIVAFGALVAATLPIIVGVLAITIALGLITIVAHFQTMSVFALTITSMVGLGVGIDYSLLIVTRFREELNRGLSPADAATRTIQTAGSAVITSGATVVVGFAALLVTPLIETRSVGIGGLLVVAIAIGIATTFLPALLAILGRGIDRPKWLARPLARFHAPTGWERWARWLGHRPWRAIALGGGIIGLLMIPLSQMKIGLPARNWFPSESESGVGLQELVNMGVSGIIQPTRVVIALPAGQSALSARRLLGLKALGDGILKDPRVKQVRGVASLQPHLSSLALTMFYANPDSVRRHHSTFFNAYLSADSRTTLVDVIPEDSVTLTGLMQMATHVRQVARKGVRGLDGATILVGGFAATSVDLQHDLLSRFPTIVALILGVTAVMLFIAFKSLLVPMKAVLLNCLSVGGAFGITVLVFQRGVLGWLFRLDGPTEAIFVVVPVLVFAVVFGLSMDYEVFLLTRVKEVFDKTGRNDHATMEGLSSTASTITFAAAIMVLVFGVFAFSRVLAVQFMGFGLAVAVLLDATLIRMVLVPAIMHIAGRWNWWPGVRAPKDPPLGH
ncbi:MAG TPA: MMPL family transporter [Gemmatimonadales bacterium]|nr:MMPL family transporter [Gemmatimonadales bacterium]